MKYFVRVGQRELEVLVQPASIQPESGAESGAAPLGLCLSVNGRAYQVETSAVQEGEKYSVLIDQRSFSVSIDGDGRELSLIVNGLAYQVAVEDERERVMREIAGPGGAQGGDMESVMPGIVRKIEVEVGSRVAAGDRLLILEAMKMENEICAEWDGVVTAVHVSDGQTVDGGDLLVSLAPATG